MRTVAIIVILVLAAALVAPLLVATGSKLAKQAKEVWRRK